MELENKLKEYWNNGRFFNYWIIESNDVKKTFQDLKRFVASVLGVKKIEYSLDFKVIEPLEKSISISQIRELSDFILQTGALNSGNFIAIQEAEKMTKSAANACLKILEDSHKLYAFLLCRNSSFLPITVRSRCVKIRITHDVDTKSLDLMNLSFECENHKDLSDKKVTDIIDNILITLNKIMTGKSLSEKELGFSKYISKDNRLLVEDFFYILDLRNKLINFNLDANHVFLLIKTKIFQE